MTSVRFVCPDCSGDVELVSTEQRIQCPRCSKVWQKREGLWHFSDEKYWGEIPEERFKDLMADIESMGLDAAKKSFKEKDEFRYNFMFSPARADWRFGIDIKPTDHVLDAGCGIGAHTFALCDLVEHVTAFDLSTTRAKFVKMRAELEGKNNIDVFQADFIHAPLPKNSFDVIVFNGLLEWIGQDEMFEDPYKVQQWVAKRCYELLKPGGRWYVGIENRWALSYFAGGRDHSGLPYTSLMPRWLSRPYCKWRKNKDYRMYTHGKPGYVKLMKDAGFEKIEAMMTYPGYNYPRILIPFDSIPALRYAIEKLMGNAGWKRKFIKLLSKVPGVLRIYRYFFHSFAIFGIKESKV
ncbi:MAG: class I SAM-dependent methyltransferase [Patescibacteria group bacterium]